MARNLGQRLQAISHRQSANSSEMRGRFLSNLRDKLAERKYRADMTLSTDDQDTARKFAAVVRYNPALGYPSEYDLMSIVAQSYSDHNIDWEHINVDEANGVVMLYLQPSVEVIPVNSVKEVPPEFTAIGTALYKRAADASGKVQEIWSLKKTDNGLALYRSPEDLEVTAEGSSGPVKGSVVDTPYGPAIVQRFDEMGNVFVQVGNKTHLVAATDTMPYDIDKERKALEDYYAQVYGDREFAKELVQKLPQEDKK